ADVVLDRFGRVGFHQRNVLVSGRVEDHVRAVSGQDLPHARFVGHVADAGHQLHGRARGHQLAVDREDAVFAPADHHQRPRSEPQNLATNLGTDAATGAGHHHGAAFQQLADGLVVELDRVAAEQVVDVNIANGDFASAVEQILRTGDDFE